MWRTLAKGLLICVFVCICAWLCVFVLVSVSLCLCVYLCVDVCVCVCLCNVWSDYEGQVAVCVAHTGQRSFPEPVAVHRVGEQQYAKQKSSTGKI